MISPQPGLSGPTRISALLACALFFLALPGQAEEPDEAGEAEEAGGPEEAGEPEEVADASASLEVQVIDRKSGEPLPFAAIFLAATDSDLSTGEDGRLQVDGLPSGPGRLVVAVDGYRRAELRVELVAGETLSLEVAMRRKRRPRNQTVVRSEPTWERIEPSGLPRGGSPGTYRLNRRDLELAPGAFGDPLRAIQKLPGVSGDAGNRAWFRLRGATDSETQVELDGIRLRHVTPIDGIVSVFNRDLVESMELHRSGTPVDRPAGLAGGLYVDAIDGPHDRFDGALDLSFLAGSVTLAAAPDAGRRNRLVVSARRSFLGPYLAAAAAAGALPGTAAAADSGEYLVRYGALAGSDHRVRLTVFGAHDRLLYDDVNIRHRTVGAAFDWSWAYLPNCSLELQLAHSSNIEDEPAVEDPYPHARRWTDGDHRTHLRLASRHMGAGRELSWGAELALQTRAARGTFEDRRSVPAWAWLPFADLDVPLLELDSSNSWPELAVWARLELREILGPLGLEIGLRSMLLNRVRKPNVSPNLAATLPLPTGTTVRASISVVHQERVDILVIDRDFGTEGLLPERAVHFGLSVEQELFELFFVGVAGWYTVSDQLVVFPDGATALQDGEFTNDGTGRSSGLDVRAALRKGRFGVETSYSLGLSYRTNPLAVQWMRTTAAGGDPRHTVRVAADATIGRRRRAVLTADYTWQSGWAIATLERVPGLQSGDYRWTPTALDDRRRPDLHRVSVRFEHGSELPLARIVGSVEVAATPSRGGAVEDCPPLADEDGSPPECRSLDFLPVVMPWLGLRAEF